MKKVVIIDCGGNILSLRRAISKFNFEANVTIDHEEIKKASHIFLPGVGAFKKAMGILEKNKLINLLTSLDFTKSNLLGICLGMQILLQNGKEDGFCEGLGLIKGSVEKIELSESDKIKNLKIPNIGWHNLNKKNHSWDNTILENLELEENCYFVHSYYANLSDKNDCLSHINYGSLELPAVIKKNKIYGCQFHPEKSGEIGLNIIKKFLELE